jgi:hypothetical protein
LESAFSSSRSAFAGATSWNIRHDRTFGRREENYGASAHVNRALGRAFRLRFRSFRSEPRTFAHAGSHFGFKTIEFSTADAEFSRIHRTFSAGVGVLSSANRDLPVAA